MGMGLTPGYTPEQQAMADAFKAQFGGGGGGAATYVAPTTIPVPACTLDTRPGGAAFSDACIAQVLAAQQQNMQLANNANYQVDLANCLNTYPQPPDCYSRTFGLTPTGGYTSDAGAGPGGSQLILNAAGQPVAVPPPVSTIPLAPPAPHPPAPPGGTPLPASSGEAPSSYVAAGADFLTGKVSVGGSSFPIWGLLAAGAAALLFLGGKH